MPTASPMIARHGFRPAHKTFGDFIASEAARLGVSPANLLDMTFREFAALREFVAARSVPISTSTYDAALNDAVAATDVKVASRETERLYKLALDADEALSRARKGEVVYTAAPEDGKWYASIVVGGREVCGDGWYDTQEEAHVAAFAPLVEDASHATEAWLASRGLR